MVLSDDEESSSPKGPKRRREPDVPAAAHSSAPSIQDIDSDSSEESWPAGRSRRVRPSPDEEQRDAVDKATSGLPESSLQASAGDSPTTSEVEADPSLAQAEVLEGASHPPPPVPDAEGGVNPSSAEVQPSVEEDQDMNQGEETPPVLEERVDASPASPLMWF